MLTFDCRLVLGDLSPSCPVWLVWGNNEPIRSPLSGQPRVAQACLCNLIRRVPKTQAGLLQRFGAAQRRSASHDACLILSPGHQ
eukprot:4821154-Pyramimonas_sp.AAC.1